MIKAIETHYKGYKFRSRLEARWAVFFDSLGLDWEYEPEGFDLDGVYYLPDFLISLNGIDCFVEIKPVYPNKEELNKGKALAYATRKPFYFLTTIPNPEIFYYCDCHILDYWAFIPANRLDKYAGIDAANGMFDFIKDIDLPPFIESLGYDTRGKNVFECDADYYFKKYSKEHPSRCKLGFLEKRLQTEKPYFCKDTEAFSKAATAARSARFEHGHSGATD